jgi:hypothetical protein
MNNLEILHKTIDDISENNDVAYTISENNVGSEIQKWFIFDSLKMGIFSIMLSLNTENLLTAFVIKGINNDIMKLVAIANDYNTVFHVPIKNYMLMDQDKMMVTMFVMV